MDSLGNRSCSGRAPGGPGSQLISRPAVGQTGTAHFSDGRDHNYAATTLRGPNAAAPSRAVNMISQLDASAGDALSRPGRDTPGDPPGRPRRSIAFVLGRSVTGPLRRLARKRQLQTEQMLATAPGRGYGRGARAHEPVQRDGGRVAADPGPCGADAGGPAPRYRYPLTVIAELLEQRWPMGRRSRSARRPLRANERGGAPGATGREFEAMEQLHDGPDGSSQNPSMPNILLIRETVARLDRRPRRPVRRLRRAGRRRRQGAALAADHLAVEQIMGDLVGNALAAVRDRRPCLTSRRRPVT